MRIEGTKMGTWNGKVAACDVGTVDEWQEQAERTVLLLLRNKIGEKVKKASYSRATIVYVYMYILVYYIYIYSEI